MHNSPSWFMNEDKPLPVAATSGSSYIKTNTQTKILIDWITFLADIAGRLSQSLRHFDAPPATDTPASYLSLSSWSGKLCLSLPAHSVCACKTLSQHHLSR